MLNMQAYLLWYFYVSRDLEHSFIAYFYLFCEVSNAPTTSIMSVIFSQS